MKNAYFGPIYADYAKINSSLKVGYTLFIALRFKPLELSPHTFHMVLSHKLQI